METKLDSVQLIGKEEILVIVDICNCCYFPNKGDKKLFFSKVCDAVGVKQLEQIPEDKFLIAYHAAKALLYKVGEDVFRAKKTWNKVSRADLLKFEEVA